MNFSSIIGEYGRLMPAMAYSARLRIKVVFSRTLLGSSWIGISTLLTAVVLGAIYGTITQVTDWRHYAAYVATGLIAWNTLSTAISNGCTVLDRSRERLLNQAFPVGVVVVEEWLTFFLGSLIALLAVLLVMVPASPAILIYLVCGGWLGILNLLVGCLVLVLIFAPLSVKFADLPQLMPTVLQISFLSSPILFESRSLGPLEWVAKINPLYFWVRLFREPLLGAMNWPLQLIILLVQILLALSLLALLDGKKMSILRNL